MMCHSHIFPLNVKLEPAGGSLSLSLRLPGKSLSGFGPKLKTERTENLPTSRNSQAQK